MALAWLDEEGEGAPYLLRPILFSLPGPGKFHALRYLHDTQAKKYAEQLCPRLRQLLNHKEMHWAVRMEAARLAGACECKDVPAALIEKTREEAKREFRKSRGGQ